MEDTPHPTDKLQQCKGALGANGKAEPGGRIGLPRPQTPAEPPMRAVCPLRPMWE